MKSRPGIVGRFAVTRASVEPCEVVACEYGAGYGWRVLLATADGALLSVESIHDIKLVATPNSDGGPYR